ncbi:hypothetical protein DLAC_01097 [Tieghemostelium lacteum]|uniref:Uncharacterized protein n=1 Tax=Tieghemostelium lacteum TaxID=361077 RepID=A0A152A896_TIELA|nr:hypothetical protein DLAC_01097 [Tieghemostelium lacteum]|eukprot:KYR02267.1 hypothetical protein DLAC_01097 [Tieghemostelium lacteum]
MNFYRVYFNGNSDSVNADGVVIFSQLIDKIRERPQLGVPNQHVDLYFTVNIDDVNNNNCDAMQVLNPLDNMWLDGNLVHPGGLQSYIYVRLNPIVMPVVPPPIGQVRVYNGNGGYVDFDPGCTWETVATNLHLSQGGLKRRNVNNNINISNNVVQSPYPAGEYTVVNAKPYGKRAATKRLIAYYPLGQLHYL